MQPTTVLCTGVLRSGSTWAFHVVRHVLALADWVTYRETGYLDGGALEDVLGTAARYHRVVQCRPEAAGIVEAARRGTVHRVVYCRRHPMAALASRIDQLSRAGTAPEGILHTAIAEVITGMDLGRRLQGVPGVLVLDPHFDGPEASLDAVLAHLGLALSPEQRAGVLREHPFGDPSTSEIGTFTEENALAGARPLLEVAGLLATHGTDPAAVRDWTTELTVGQITKACVAFAEYGDFGSEIGPSANRGSLVGA